MTDKYYTINIYSDDKPLSLVDEIKSLDKPKQKKKKTDEEPVILSDILEETPIKATKKGKKTKKVKSLLYGAFDTNDEDYDSNRQEIDEDTLLDIEKIMNERGEEYDSSIIKEQKKNYKKLKKDDNIYKKEFAEELTLLYNLLDETSKFGKGLEKDLAALKGSKARGVSKYTNDLANTVLASKQNKLQILKEISSIKKTIADLKIKADSKNNNNKDDNGNNPEYLASAYFKNIMNHGRTNFISSLNSNTGNNDDYEDIINTLEGTEPFDNKTNDGEYDEYTNYMMSRLDAESNPYRSEEGSKYIEYENRNVKLYVKKCIDTNEWEFIALDKDKIQIHDYPLPSKRDAGRMKFSDDGLYATDSKGRIYNVIEYFLDDESL